MFILQLFAQMNLLFNGNRPRPQPQPPQQALAAPPPVSFYTNPALFRRQSTIMCHGNQSQSQGFTLSLRGFDPDADFRALLAPPPPRRP